MERTVSSERKRVRPAQEAPSPAKRNSFTPQSPSPTPLQDDITPSEQPPFTTTSIESQANLLRQLSQPQQQSTVSRIGQVQGNRHVVQLLAQVRQRAAQRQEASDGEKESLPYKEDVAIKNDSARFAGDKKFEDVSTGAKTIKKGAKGRQVVRMQQALRDMGYLLPTFGVDGIFWNETKAALEKFQTDAGLLPPTGEFDKATMDAMDKKFDTRQPYIDNATFDPLDPNKGTRKLSADDKSAVKSAMVPARGTGGAPAAF